MKDQNFLLSVIKQISSLDQRDFRKFINKYPANMFFATTPEDLVKIFNKARGY